MNSLQKIWQQVLHNAGSTSRGTGVLQHQSGVTLIFSLIMLMVTLLLGLSIARISLMGEKSARNDYDHHLALYSAELALADAELDITNSPSASSRSALFSPLSAEGFVAGCSRGTGNMYQGLCLASDNPPYRGWFSSEAIDAVKNSISVEFGQFTGQTMPVGKGPLPIQLPRYVIELLVDKSTGQASEIRYLYRITAIGFGTSSSTQAVVQSVYRKSIQ